jgi:hypothetical protein
MLISSESYSYSANFTHAPDPPDTVSFSDFEVSYSDYDTDNNGLNTSENENYTAAQNDASENYTAAMDVYNDAHDTYLKSLDDHNDLMTIYAGKAIYWRNIAPGFIVAGLVCMTFQSKAVKMSNSIRLTLLIGTLYMVANMLGYDMPGVDAAIGFGFGG